MKIAIVYFFVLILMGCKHSKPDRKAEGEKVMELSKSWSEFASKKDLEKTVSYWADDALMISAGEPVLEGKQAIEKMVKESFEIPGFGISWQPRKVEVSGSGDMAYLIEDSQVKF
jgi:ketosteroid isomerase-like protein